MHRLCWWENSNKTKTFFILLYPLGVLNKMKLMLCALFNYNIGGKIRRLSMNVAFKFIWQKRLSCLTHGRIVYLCIMYQSLHDYDYQLPEMGCAFLVYLVKTMVIREWS